MTASPILQALRSSTGDAHAALDRHIDFDARVRDPRRRRRLVGAFRRLHASTDRLFARALPTRLRPASRLTVLDQDLSDLAFDGDRPVDDLGATSAQALGWAYVIVGSSLGGHVLRRGLVSDGVDLTGLGFLDADSGVVGARWRALVAMLDAEAAAGRAPTTEVTAGAVAAFAYAHAVLIEPGSDATAAAA
ncbi:biliverdin-producing heme oxygenase [Brevundimonas sp. VNH65]|uniref:biliverdin-producing heme oxygenase n=1 Tax=Brevundimonas sp. VNH65 TaxID=3400917 RepID=UPI003C0DE02C